MAYSFQYLNNSGTAAVDGVYIPVANLPGIVSSELATTESAPAKAGKTLLALLNRIFDVLSPSNFGKLGIAVAKAAPAGVAPDIFNQTFTMSWQKMVNLDNNTVEQIPVPTTGANTGVGKFSILDVFPGATKVVANDNISGAGIVIPTSALSHYSSLTHAELTVSANSDNREWFTALFDHLAIDADVRSASQQSAIIATTASQIGALPIPVNFTQATNPVSGILPADLPRRGLIVRTLTYTIQCVVNQSTQTFDVNVN
jgi:hypothetical protein